MSGNNIPTGEQVRDELKQAAAEVTARLRTAVADKDFEQARVWALSLGAAVDKLATAHMRNEDGTYVVP